jgi:predicted lipoprotein with Yx(FWY)xxD motif
MVLSKIGLALLGGAGVIAASGCAYDDGMRYNQRSDAEQVRPAPPAYVHYRQHNTSIYGPVYLNASGQALYVRQRDRRNQSTCYGDCARQWPPYLAYGDVRSHGRWSIINRRDGTRQWAYAGHPTYMWSGDREQGQISGHRRDGTWSVLQAPQVVDGDTIVTTNRPIPYVRDRNGGNPPVGADRMYQGGSRSQ